MKKSLFTIQRLMVTFGLIIVGLLTFLGLQTYSSIDDIRIGSTNYTRIVMGKDLIADILPPPLYPAEAFAYMHILEDEPESVSEAERPPRPDRGRLQDAHGLLEGEHRRSQHHERRRNGRSSAPRSSAGTTSSGPTSATASFPPSSAATPPRST